MKSVEDSYREICEDQQQIDELVERELPEVYYQAARIRERLPHHLQMQDLIQAGVVGLLEARRTFDPKKDAQFKSFAKFRIRGAILDSLRELDWGSRAVRKKGREIRVAEGKLEKALGRQPEEEEIAAEVNLSLAELQGVRREIDGLYLVGQQVESSFQDGSVHDLIESAPASDSENPFERCAEGERRELLVKAVSELSEKEQTVLSLYYQEEMTMREIAEILGYVQSRVSQIHTEAMGKLRRRLKGPMSVPTRQHPARVSTPAMNSQPTARRRYECTA